MFVVAIHSRVMHFNLRESLKSVNMHISRCARAGKYELYSSYSVVAGT